ncbi:MAG: hypothetical protein DSZ24_06740 [Thermodesulfatator sp.]|nr:MAG: hypothetical protein DSZ24_06740 [Thermodesulfatator sp.]
MASPQVENGYTRVANELLEALCRAQLGGREMRVVLAVIRLTYGFQNKESAISLGKLAKITGLRRERLSEVVKALERKNVLRVSRENGQLILGLQKDYSRWVSQKGVSQKGGSPKMGLSQKGGSPKMGQGVPKKGNTDTPQSLEPQAFHGPLKKNIKENSLKKTSSIKEDSLKESSFLEQFSCQKDDDLKKGTFYSPEEVKEVVSRWEGVFGEAFPAERTPEGVRAADYMLYLYESGRLPAVRRPSAYLKKLAASELEPFPGLSERRARARAAEERLREQERHLTAQFYAKALGEGFPLSAVPEDLRPLVEALTRRVERTT